jgi:membrane-associated phospholipid phosphatase
MSQEPGVPAPARPRHPPALAFILPLLALAASTIVAPAVTRAGDDPGAGLARSRPPLVRLTRGDAWFGVAAALGVGAAAFADHELRARAIATDGEGARNLAKAVRPFGAPEVMGPALVLSYLAGRALDRPAFAAASKRVGISVAVAAVAVAAIKIPIGRVRPEDSAEESDPYQPFSGHASFPSGHAAIAFATATALDRETEARWVPWVAYPLAALTGWSRVRDDNHWSSDVVAGAALGAWTAAKTHEALRSRAARAGRVGLSLDGGGGSVRTAVRLSF